LDGLVSLVWDSRELEVKHEQCVLQFSQTRMSQQYGSIVTGVKIVFPRKCVNISRKSEMIRKLGGKRELDYHSSPLP
jgi:hypothetical protein